MVFLPRPENDRTTRELTSQSPLVALFKTQKEARLTVLTLKRFHDLCCRFFDFHIFMKSINFHLIALSSTTSTNGALQNILWNSTAHKKQFKFSVCKTVFYRRAYVPIAYDIILLFQKKKKIEMNVNVTEATLCHHLYYISKTAYTLQTWNRRY